MCCDHFTIAFRTKSAFQATPRSKSGGPKTRHPLPPLHHFAQDGMLARGFEALGIIPRQARWRSCHANTGDDPSLSVADGFGRSHDIRNLLIAGPGLFPNAGAMNPNFSDHAVNLRAVANLLEHWHDQNA
jgi:hypothetical protein